jgi:hypothetical protein
MSPSIATSRMPFILPERRKTSRARLNLSAPGHELPDVSRFLITRRAGVLTAAAAAAVLGTAVPALADVTVDPPSAPQGSGANLTFRVTNTEPSAITRVTLMLPADSPIAEVYPLSVDDWAPQITNRTLATPLATIHGGTPATETASAITWIAMPGRSLAPGKSADLSVAVGPLPTLSQMQFTVEATLAGGTTPVALPPVTLALTPATAQEQAATAEEHAGHGAAGTEAGDPAPAVEADQLEVTDQGSRLWSAAGWLLAALAAAAAIVTTVRGRRRPAAQQGGKPADKTGQPADETGQPADGAKEPVGAGAGKIRATGWRYRDSPDPE